MSKNVTFFEKKM